MRKIWREVTRKMAAQFENMAPLPRLGRAREAAELRNHHDSRMPARYGVKSLQTLHLNYGDQMAQFVFDVARHGDGMSDLLAQ
jgi:hypothetical protein